MKWAKKQEQVEQTTYRIIDDLVDELGIRLNQYPEVYWVGRGLGFQELGIPEEFRLEYNRVRRQKISVYFYKPNIVLIGLDNDVVISEEAGHFLHFTNSNLTLNSGDFFERMSRDVLSEMFGYFCSKLVQPQRTRHSSYEVDGGLDEFLEELEDLPQNTIDEEFIYNYSHHYGGILFDAYISGLITKEGIKRLFFKRDYRANKAGFRALTAFIVKWAQH